MKTARNHSESRRIDLYPQTKICPQCHQPFKERYHKQRWIVKLSGELKVVSHCLGCQNRECDHSEAVYRPEEENILALKGYTFGLDVIVYIGQLRYRENKTITAIHNQLVEKIAISVKEVALLCEVFLALVTTVAQEDPKLIAELHQLGGIILAIDGIQPEKGNETVYLLREARLGRVLVAANLLSSATEEIETLIEQVKQLGVPIIGVVSDKQHSICLAIKRQLPEIPHQLCQYHYLKDLAEPACEQDRQLKKELKKKIRQIRPIEVAAQKSDQTSEAQIVQDYCLAIRTVMRTRGKYPLEFPGVELYQKLVQIIDSLERSLSIRASELLSKLRQRLSIVPTYQAGFDLLNQALKWIRQIAHLLDTETAAPQAIKDLLNYLAQRTQEITDTTDLSLARELDSDLTVRALLNQWLNHFQKTTTSFGSKLFSCRQEPLLPKTNNDLEIFIGQVKKSRRQITGRKNTQSFILREGSAVAILFGLPIDTNWLESFATVELDNFRTALAALRRSSERSKCWRIRRDLKNYLSTLEQQWFNSE